jgi:hypothetical protein
MHLSRSIDRLFQRYLCSADLLASLSMVVDSLLKMYRPVAEPLLLAPTSPILRTARRYPCREEPWR